MKNWDVISNQLHFSSDTVNPFTAEVAIMWLLGSAPKSHLCVQRRRSKVCRLVWLNDSFYWPRVFILQTDAKSIQCFQKHAKLIENLFSRSKVQLTRVWELLTRRWNVWHWESHCVFTAGGERVKELLPLDQSLSCKPLNMSLVWKSRQIILMQFAMEK
jgi:hypothetical protein